MCSVPLPECPERMGAVMLLEIEDVQEPRGFRLAGEIDLSNAHTLSERLMPATEDGGDLTLDLSELRFIDSSGIRVLVQAFQTLETKGARLILRSPLPPVRDVFALMDLPRAGFVIEDRSKEP
jgi:anti-anti-sigma factor